MANNASALLLRVELLERRLSGDGSAEQRIHGASDTFWLLFCGALVNFMQVGFAMLETGSVRQKNSMNILIKNLLDVCSGALAWFAFGSSIARDGDGAVFGMHSRSLFSVVEADAQAEDGQADADGYLLASWSFQFVFAATATTIVSGAMAERTQILAFLSSSFLATGLIYPVVARWIWCPKGWLAIANPAASLGMLDFAGSGVVHLTGGVMSLCGAAIVGPRRGRFDANRRPVRMPGHNAALQVLGTFFLWIGWYGFNPGSTLRISTPHMSRVAARTVLTTTLSAVAGGLTASIGNKLLLSKTWQVMAVCNGILAGLVSITAGCSVVLPPHALLVGSGGGVLYLGVSHWTLHKLKVDDPLDAFAVHGGCGLWGLLAAALLAHPSYVGSVGLATHGAFYGEVALLGAAAVGSLAIIAWVSACSSLLFLLLQRLGALRVDVQSELVGLDCIEHDGPPPISDAISGLSPVISGLSPAISGRSPNSSRHGLPEERVHAGSHGGSWSSSWWALGPLPALEEPTHHPTPNPPPNATPHGGGGVNFGTRPGGRQRWPVGVVSSHRVATKAASVHGGESWRPPPAHWGGGAGGKQPPSPSGLRRACSTGTVLKPLSPGAAARAALAAAAPQAAPGRGYSLMEEPATGVQLPILRRVGSGPSTLSAIAARCRATIGHAATVHGASNFEV